MSVQCLICDVSTIDIEQCYHRRDRVRNLDTDAEKSAFFIPPIDETFDGEEILFGI